MRAYLPTQAKRGLEWGAQNIGGCVETHRGICGFFLLATKTQVVMWWRTSAPRTQKMTSSAMLVAWSPTRSRLRAIISAFSACGVSRASP